MSLLSLLKMTDADFVCYTSDRQLEMFEEYFYDENKISKEQLKFEVFDLNNIKSQHIYDKFKNEEDNKKNDRCFAIQYSKMHWWWNEDKSYDYYYWIDAGFSHCGLLPDKHLKDDGSYRRYFESDLFNNKFIKNLIEFTGNKFFIIAKDNLRNFWAHTVNPKWYKEFDMSLHIIGGLFGGKKELWDEYITDFENNLEKISLDSSTLYSEEQIMTLMYFNNKDFFVKKDFDIWWCPDNGAEGTSPEHYIINKSFYKILEELNE
jgi:hypothetical protein